MSKLTVLPTLRTTIVDTNARYLGVDISQLMEKAGDGIARQIIQKYGKTKSIAFLCGLGNNGGDGVAAARHLILQGYKGQVSVYLVGKSPSIRTPAAKKHWHLIQDFQRKYETTNLSINENCYAKEVDNHELLVECLVGTGIKGSLRKRMRDIITRVTHFRQTMIAVDIPVLGYTWDLSISMMYPKTSDAVAIDIGMPDTAEMYTGPGEVQALIAPKKKSYKSQNGKLLIIAGSTEFHGSLVLAAKAASKYVGLVYIFTTSENRHLISELESELAEFIEVGEGTLEATIDKVDAVLIGPGWGEHIVNKSLLDYLLKSYPDKKFILDAGAIKLADLALVKELKEVLFTPHRGELKSLMQAERTVAALQGQLKRFCAEYSCYINLKGSSSILVGPNMFTSQIDTRINRTGNEGMAKGGSGDILAGLTAAYATKNSLWLSMVSASFVTGIAADIAKQEMDTSYSATDIVDRIGPAWKIIREF